MQPYMMAYIKSIGGKKAKSWEYISWITNKHREFRKLNGLGEYEPYSTSMKDKFIRFINS